MKVLGMNFGLFLLIAVMGIVFLLVFVFQDTPPDEKEFSGEENKKSIELVKCLNDNDVAVYGQAQLPEMRKQLKVFSPQARENLRVIDCREDENKNLCDQKGIIKTPSWSSDNDNDLFEGWYLPEKLSDIYKCED